MPSSLASEGSHCVHRSDDSLTAHNTHRLKGAADPKGLESSRGKNKVTVRGPFARARASVAGWAPLRQSRGNRHGGDTPR